MQSLKQWVQNCKRSCAHKIPMLNVVGWTDGRTNGRKLARLFLPAKAGATKIFVNKLLSLAVNRPFTVPDS